MGINLSQQNFSITYHTGKGFVTRPCGQILPCRRQVQNLGLYFYLFKYNGIDINQRSATMLSKNLFFAGLVVFALVIPAVAEETGAGQGGLQNREGLSNDLKSGGPQVKKDRQAMRRHRRHRNVRRRARHKAWLKEHPEKAGHTRYFSQVRKVHPDHPLNPAIEKDKQTGDP